MSTLILIVPPLFVQQPPYTVLPLRPISAILEPMAGQDDLYDSIAPYYDTLHASLTEDVGLVLSLAAQGGPILELGCGTGRLLIPLARAGRKVTGIDRSPAMLQLAQERLWEEPDEVRRRVILLCADMVDFSLGEPRFKLALVSYNTFLHLDATRAVAACRNIARHLAPDGQLYIDVVNPLLAEQTPNDNFLTHERLLKDEEGDELVLVFAANRLDEGRQELHITWIFDASSLSGGPVRRRVANVTYHYYFPHQLELMLDEAGLELVQIYGNYHQEPYSEDADRLIILARRRA